MLEFDLGNFSYGSFIPVREVTKLGHSMRLTIKGGPGSGWHAPPRGTHTSSQGMTTGSGAIIPHISGTYPESPKERRVSKNYAGGGPYNEVDAAVMVPVQYLNEVLGLHTYASCEGHHKEWGDRIGNVYDEEGHLQGHRFQESYIGIKTDSEQSHSIYDYLESQGFEESSTARTYMGKQTTSLYRNYGNGMHLEVDFTDSAKELSILSFRVGRGTIDMAKAREVKLGEMSLRNSSSSYAGAKPVSQNAWDAARDNGWETFLQLLTEHERAT